MRIRPAIVIAMCAVGAVAACSNKDDPEGPGPTTPTPKAALAHSNFGSCGELREYYARALTADLLRPSGACWGCPKASEAKSFDVQEAGDDRAFVVQADPDNGYFYLLRDVGDGSDLVTVKAVPAESMTITSRLDVTGGGHPFNRGLFLDAQGGRLVLVKPRLDPPAEAGYPRPNINTSLHSAEVLFYDVSDPAQPQLADRLQVTGLVLGSRRVGSRVHLVVHTAAEFPTSLGNSPGFYELLAAYQAAVGQGSNPLAARLLGAEIRNKVDDAVRRAPIDELVPLWRQGFGTAYAPLDCRHISRPQLDITLGFVTVASINLDGSDLGLTAAASESWVMHANDENLYLIQESKSWWWSPAQTHQSVIFRYRLGETGPAQLTGHGLVDGRAWGRDELSEHEGRVRVRASQATYDAAEERWLDTNHLFVLGPADGDPLAVVGQVRDFGRELAVFGARFDGDRAYLSLSGSWPPPESKPLLTFDLSDPAQPRIAGALAAPVASNELRRHGEGRLVGIGQDVTTEGFWMHLQVFDVTDLSMPQGLADLRFGDDHVFTVSTALNEPQALTLDGDLVVVPLRTREDGPDRTGFAVHRLTDAGGIEPIGWVDHDNSRVLRSLVIEEDGRTVLYTLSDGFLKAHAAGADTLTPIQSLPLAD